MLKLMEYKTVRFIVGVSIIPIIVALAFIFAKIEERHPHSVLMTMFAILSIGLGVMLVKGWDYDA